MRKTLRALFLGSAMGLAALSGTATAPALAQNMPGFTTIDPYGTPRPPSAEQQVIYDLVKQLMTLDTALVEPQIRALETLEDNFYEGSVDETAYRTQRAEILTTIFPELKNGYEEFENRTGRIIGCTADGVSVYIPVITMVNRNDMTALFNRMGAGNSSAANFLTTITDMGNRIRQGITDGQADAINPFKFGDLGNAQQLESALGFLQRLATTAARDAQVDIQFRTLPAKEIDIACTPPQPRAPQP